MNKLHETIIKLQKETDRDELREKLLQMLLDKEALLGPDISDEEAEHAVIDVLKEHLRLVLTHKLGQKLAEDQEDEDPEVWDDEMEDAIQVIRSVFDEMDLHYRDYLHQKGVLAFDLGTRSHGKILRLKVYLESSPRVCRIDAVYPFQADNLFAYPLCEKMLSESYPRRYGALQYDPRDGELSYRYSFPITHGLHRDDFHTVFLAVVASAMASYDVVRQYAVGRFHKADRDSIICKAQKMIIELDQ